MKSESVLKLNHAIGGLEYLINVHVEGTDISGKSVKPRLMSHVRSLKELLKISTSKTVCSCGRQVTDSDEIAFFVYSGECGRCDHVRGELNA